jgi:hypothetical protein
MAAKILNTRIQNRLDTLVNWQAEGVELLKGEIALVSVATQQIDAATGNIVSVPAILMKVGDSDAEGNPKAFSELPWLSAKAADVYDWAKSQYAKDISVGVVTGTDTEGNDVVTTTTLGAWLAELNSTSATTTANVSAIEAKLAGIDETVLKTLAEAISALNHTDNLSTVTEASGRFVRAIAQADGKVTVTYANITEDDIPEISANKVIVTPAVGNEGDDGYIEAVTVADKITEVESELSSLKTSVAGGVHFVGTVSEVPTGAVITINGSTSHSVTAGDVVIYAAEGTEYIYTGSTWEELGDTTRIGELELKLDSLDVSDVAVATQFVTAVSQEDGKITVSRAQPTADDVLYTADGADTIKTKIDANTHNVADNTAKLADITSGTTVGEAITAAIEALDFEDPTAEGNAISFIDSISQADGVISATKKTIPDAGIDTKGLVTLGTRGGAATFDSVDTLSSDVSEISSSYMRIGDDNNLYAGRDNNDVIIFNCGNASSWMTE